MTATRTKHCGCPARGRLRLRLEGMTLVEIMVVAAIVSVLLLLAVPTYRGHVLRSHRIEGAAALLAIAAAQETFYLRHHMYAADLTAAPPDGLGLPSVSASGYYSLAITSADSDGFEATATPAGGQSDDSHCLAFSIDEAGTRSATSADCWSR